ncbi:MAG: ABC transporter permease [Acidimicrobiales bacterium]|nr:ABC transporter permease [Acidimicrobiales bacterium]
MTSITSTAETSATETKAAGERGGAWNRIMALASIDLRILKHDPAFLIVFTVMPLLFMGFNREVMGSALLVTGDVPPGADLIEVGARFLVPGSTVLFSGFLVGNIGFGVFREHGWGTWERLRASVLSPMELMLGKAVVPALTSAFQLTVLLGGGAVLFDMGLDGSVVAYALVALALLVTQVSLGFMLLSLCRSVMQLNAITNAGAMLLGGLGGALTPVEMLPGWAQAVAPAAPTYWAMEGFRAVTMENGGIADVARPVAVMLAFTAAFLVVAVNRFQVEDTKVSWA